MFDSKYQITDKDLQDYIGSVNSAVQQFINPLAEAIDDRGVAPVDTWMILGATFGMQETDLDPDTMSKEQASQFMEETDQECHKRVLVAYAASFAANMELHGLDKSEAKRRGLALANSMAGGLLVVARFISAGSLYVGYASADSEIPEKIRDQAIEARANQDNKR